jgi:iron(III) transport system permease protein
MDSQMEECARVLGASRNAIAFKIIIPLVRPALLSAALLILPIASAVRPALYPRSAGAFRYALHRAVSRYRARQSGVAVIATVIMLMGMLTRCWI